MYTFPPLIQHHRLPLWITALCSLPRLRGFLHRLSLQAVRQVSLTISATQSSEVMKHSVPGMWQEIHICLLCSTLRWRCSSVCSSEDVLGRCSIKEQLCVGTEQCHRVGIDFLLWFLKKANINSAKSYISMAADNRSILPESIVNTALKSSIIQWALVLIDFSLPVN